MKRFFLIDLMLLFTLPSLKAEILFSESQFVKEAVTAGQVLAANTKEDAELMIALLERHASFEEFDAFANQRKIIVLPIGIHIIIDRVEVMGPVLVHEKGVSRGLWISFNSFIHGCIKAD
jgi:hypothetical protein